MTQREKSGLVLAATARIVRRGDKWVVPSQKTAAKSYLVDPAKGTCTCPDQKEWGHKCKHIHAVEIVAKRDGADRNAAFMDTNPLREDEDLEPKKKAPWRPKDWAAYNLAQITEKRRFQKLLYELCKPLVNPIQRSPGRPRLPLSDAVFAVAFKIYSTVSYRRFACDLDEAVVRGYISKPLHFNLICRYLDWPPMTQVLFDLIERSSLPLRAVETEFSVDSTGFSCSRFVKWFDEKYGFERSGHDWVKVHLMAGVRTQIVTAVQIRERTANDAPLFGPLVALTARNFRISEVAADKAYSSLENLQQTLALGAQPYIPFKDNATTERGGVWEKMLLYYTLHREEFLQHYHKRSTVESVFAAIKSKFRDHVRSRTTTAMKNEALCKILCHNLCVLIRSQCELGIEPVFWPADAEPVAAPPQETEQPA
jgi:transposase